MMKTTKLILAGMLAFGICACSNNDSREKQHPLPIRENLETVTGVARIEPEQGLLSLYANANGRIESIEVSENEEVATGSPLLTLDGGEEKALLQVEESKVAEQNAGIEVAIRNAESVKADLDKAESDLTLNKKLYAADAITEQALNDSRAKVARLRNDYAKALADKRQQMQKTGELRANIGYRRELLNERTLKSAYHGKVLQWDVHVGDYVAAGQKIGQFAPAGPIVALTEVDELFQDKIRIGMKADIISQLNGKRIATGRVVYMSDYLKKKSLFSDENSVEDRRVREVKVRLDHGAAAVINSKVDCVIKLR